MICAREMGGAILEVYGDGYYEVQFDYPDGVTNKIVCSFPEEQLEKWDGTRGHDQEA